MFNNTINYRYYGANVRVMPCGTGFDKTLIVQLLNALTGGWIDQRTICTGIMRHNNP